MRSYEIFIDTRKFVQVFSELPSRTGVSYCAAFSVASVIHRISVVCGEGSAVLEDWKENSLITFSISQPPPPADRSHQHRQIEHPLPLLTTIPVGSKHISCPPKLLLFWFWLVYIFIFFNLSFFFQIKEKWWNKIRFKFQEMTRTESGYMGYMSLFSFLKNTGVIRRI